MKFTASALNSGAYTTGFSTLLNDYIPPTCPTSAVGAPQLYNTQTKQCVNIPAATIPPSGQTAQSCGGAPFQVNVGGQCYPTNNCTTKNSDNVVSIIVTLATTTTTTTYRTTTNIIDFDNLSRAHNTTTFTTTTTTTTNITITRGTTTKNSDIVV